MSTSSQARLPLLATLYIAQGLPFGYQAHALPVALREAGVGLEALGLLGALALPWALKPLWAPFVDATSPFGLGRRRGWIVLAQAGQLVACVAAAMLDPSRQPEALLVTVLAMNVFAATQDIATDGLAVDLLPPDALGWGNTAQVVGYKIGMLVGGGLLVWWAGHAGWGVVFPAMAGLEFAVLLVAFAAVPRDDAIAERAEHTPLGVLVGQLLQALRAPSSRGLLALVATYKLGESMTDAMFKPFLVDNGIDKGAIGLWIGVVGMGASLGGSWVAGWLVAHRGLGASLQIALAARAAGMVGAVLLAIFGVGEATFAVVTFAEHAGGGLLTTTMFATMMASVDRRFGASHYTALAALEVVGKGVGGAVGGLVARHFGFTLTFSLGLALAVAVLPLGSAAVRSFRADVDAANDAASTS
ncbi:MAG: hypothetical protein RIT45_3973 [Pseudomonadota bacterium]|jgi:predicted MFS family arabinose efflux permease